MSWVFNPFTGNFDYDTSGTATVPESTQLTIRNETGVSIATTRAVYVTGFNNHPLVALADNTNEAKHNVIGVTIGAIAHEADGTIATGGEFDAETNSWTVGDELYLSTSGQLTNTEPTSGGVLHIGIVTVKENYPVGKILLYTQPEGNVMAVGSSQDAIIRMGDNAGTNKVSFRDYANNEVASVNSDGAFSAVSYSGLTPAQITDLTDGGATTLHTHSGGTPTFPVGYIYLSTVATNPATLLGYGTWVAIATGRVLVGIDTGDPDFDTVKETGGAKTVASAGTNTAPTFTGTAMGTHTHGAGTYSATSVSGGTPSGTLDSVSGGTPSGTISYPVNVPTFTGNALAGHTHTFTGSALAGHTHTFTGTASVATSAANTGSTQRGATTSTLTLAAHTHSFTSSGTNSSVSGGTPAGTLDSVGAGTPSGSIAWPANPPTFAGDALAGHTHSFTGSALAGHTHSMSNSSEGVSAGTPAGTNSAPTFTGSATSVVQPYFVCYIFERTA